MMKTILDYKNRIALLESRTNKDNKRIITKLKRKLKKLEEDYTT